MVKPEDKDVQTEDKDVQPEFKTREWLPWAIGATIGFCLRTNFIAEVTKASGPFTCLYLAFGAVLMSASYFLIICAKNKMDSDYGHFWMDFNLVEDGKPKSKNILGLIIFLILYLLAQNG